MFINSSRFLLYYFNIETSCRPLKEGSFFVSDNMGLITLEKNGKALDIFSGEVTTDRIHAIQVLPDVSY